ncbi:MAG: Ig-like domain-containing protein [Candidatus Amulumruptor caecigallinarius]|nr:Ig-like domain-containing protein [Candidatus Amulumruptor caecigallinarius]
MKKTPTKILSFLLPGVALLTGACANMGIPSGGPRDEEPPVLVSATPPMGAVNVKSKRITLTFNEYINLKDAFQKVVTSPPTGAAPKISFLGKRVFLDFDSLAPNTTYTIDFADAIEDNNESNPLQGFAYTFSTGDHIDTLRIAGRVLSARNLEPQQGMIVGVHANLNDSAFSTIPLLRMAKTDDRGQFNIRGLAPGKYRVFALDDRDNDYKYSSPEEDIAFYDVIVSPTARNISTTDTLYNSATGKIDTISERIRTQYLPNDILLRSFNSEKRQQYLVKAERPDSSKVFFKFNTRTTQLPKLQPIGFPPSVSMGVVETRPGLDSIICWLPPALVSTDSLQVAATYERTDSTGRLSLFTDTLRLFYKREPVKKKQGKRVRRLTAADSIARITSALHVTSSNTQEVNLPVYLESSTPVKTFRREMVHLLQLEDSVYRKVSSEPVIEHIDSLSPRHFKITYPWKYGGKYRLEVDSLAFIDIYDKPSLPLTHDFNVKEEKEYCSITFNIFGLSPGMPAFVELLNNGDAVVATAEVKNSRAYFPFLAPGRYYARIIEDNNGNGTYDTGDYDKGVQPELAYYYPKAFNLKKNWDKQENWNVFDIAVDMMKPAAVTRNKPATRKRSANNDNDTLEEDEDELFDPTRNPFDPNDRGRRRTTVGSY